MGARKSDDPLHELLGSAHVFVSAVSGVMETRLLAESAGNRLSSSQLKILKLLGAADALSVGEVAAFLGVSDAAASKAVDRLVRRKYLRRTQARSDRRSSELSLSASGEKLIREYDGAMGRKLSQLFGSVPADDLQRTAEFLERLTKVIVQESANPEEICLQCGIYLQRCLVRDAARADCSYHRKAKRMVRQNGTKDQTPARGGPRVGPPG